MTAARPDPAPMPDAAVPDLRAAPLGRTPSAGTATILRRVLAASGTDIPAAAFQSSI